MDDLYHPRVLELAADIAHLGRLANPMGMSDRVSRVCGSSVHVEVRVEEGVVTAFAIEPKACALGQAAASVLAGHIVGATVAQVVEARNGLRAMLTQNAPPPSGRFWELRHLEAVRHYPPRHASTLLAFDAAVDAIEQALAKEDAAP